jgi:hypothetical protein
MPPPAPDPEPPPQAVSAATTTNTPTRAIDVREPWRSASTFFLFKIGSLHLMLRGKYLWS